MRDLQLNDFADSLREKLVDKGIVLPKLLVRFLTKAFFLYVEKIASSGNSRFVIRHGDLFQVYTVFDIHKLCGELAEGKDVVTIDSLRTDRKLSRRVISYLNKSTRSQIVTDLPL